MPDTSAALIDQLVYIDNFINSGTGETPNLDVDGQLSLDLAAFADDLFVFPDEDKPNDRDHNDEDNDKNDKRHMLDVPGVGRFDDHWFDNDDDFSLNSARRPDGIRALAKINLSTKQAKLNRTNHYANNGGMDAHPPLQDGSKDNDALISSEMGDLSTLPKFPVPPGAKSSLQQVGLSLNQIDLLSALIAQHQNSLGHALPPSDVTLGPSASHQPLSIAPTLASNGHGLTDSLILNELEVASSLVVQRNGGHNSNFLVDSPGSGSMYSSGYSSGGTSMLSTPQVAPRGSNLSGGSGGSTLSGGSGGSTLTGGGGQALLVEDVKRKRNTAASARFRIKKKLKEKEMEEKIDQLDEMIKKFELKINELEMENRLLKNLIIEKGNRNSDQELKLLKERVRHHSEDSIKRE